MPRPAFPFRLFSDYSMLGVLLLLCLCCTLGTIQQRKPVGAHAAAIVAEEIANVAGEASSVVIVAKDMQFADEMQRLLDEQGISVAAKVTGELSAMRKQLEQLLGRPQPIDLIATTMTERSMVNHTVDDSVGIRVVHAKPYWESTFLTASNLLNVARKNVDIALIAVGMTMVIITGGIDLSVGSLIALSAVTTAVLIVSAGGQEATPAAMFACSVAAIAVCAGVGGFSGLMITLFQVPPFVATLAMMWVASGLAYIVSEGETIDIPTSFERLGVGADLGVIPNSLLLMIVVFVIGNWLMSSTKLGRHIYAIGGNRQAARLSGIRVNRTLLIVYTISGAMAGLAGVLLASQFTDGSPRYGRMYELQAIAAVVVGGTSLAGGEGRILGTLIGVLIIAVVQTAMNLLAIGSHWQNVALGLIVLLVVLLDMLKKQGWRRLGRTE